ncbi:MAG TPA: Ig-like domain-containing protein [Chitinophagaceae bacterium]|nr:Ig-like domain-containing protein [Chitinophagaceae bacterium]
MKTIFLVPALFFSLVTGAQFSQNFDGSLTSLTGNCWTLVNMNQTTASGDVIHGTASLYSNPPTSSSGTRNIITPFLNINTSSLTISFAYKLSSKLSGQATRTIEIGLLDVNNSFVSLKVIKMDKNSPITVQTFSQTFTGVATGVKQLELKLGGATGDGNSRLIFDDLSVSASAYYSGGGCNSAPIAVDDNIQSPVLSTVSGHVLTNDSDPNGETIKPTLVTGSPDGTVVLNGDGSFVFTPNPGFTGTTTTFTYQLKDNGYAPMTSNIATVTINFPAPVILPVTLEYFTAQLTGTSVNLTWATASEQNAGQFLVERSDDGMHYRTVALVFAAGNSVQEQHYGFKDAVASKTSGMVYYRLKCVDEDGKFTYSQVRTIRLGNRQLAGQVKAYPNPFAGEIRVTLPADWQGKAIRIELYDAGGRVVKRQDTGNASQTETLNASDLTPGLYILQVRSGTQHIENKLIKQ